MAKGIIFDIKEMAIHDGPGIRTTVFFKGCPLKCVWCHNPEGLSFEKELMVSKSLCINCGRCREVCQNSECIACGKCISVCPQGIRKIVGYEMDAGDLAEDLKRHEEFFKMNEGGVTVSGGEPLAQPEFLIDLLKHLKPIHTVVETSGFAPKETFIQVAELVNLTLFDIKHSDPVIHKRYARVDNKQIMENLHYLINTKKRFIIRIPLIPGINDSLENMVAIADIIKYAQGLERVELLSYNKLAGAKYEMVGKRYNIDFDENVSPGIYTDEFEKHGIKCLVL